MEVEVKGQVGPQILADGAQGVARQGRTGDLTVSEYAARYYEMTKRGQVFMGGNQGAQAVSVALATTYTGLCLSNPIGNTVDLVLLQVGFGLSVAPAGIASLHLIGGYSPTTDVTHTAALTPRSTKLGPSGTPAASGKLDNQATIPTPVYLMALQHGFTAAALPNHSMQPLDVGGLIIVPPGGFVAIGALTAVTGFGSFVWAEVPV